MTDNKKIDLLHFISEAIHDSNQQYDYNSESWPYIIKKTQELGMSGISMRRFRALSNNNILIREYVSTSLPSIISLSVKELNKAKLIKTICEKAKANSIPILVFKGPILNACYPEPSTRFTSDTDIFVEKDYLEPFTSIMLDTGYQIDAEKSHDRVRKFYCGNAHYVEVHIRLYSNIDGKTTKILDDMKLTDNPIEMNAMGISCETLNPTNHLIFLLFHTLKHIFVERASIRQVCDLLLFLYKYVADIDFELLKERLINVEYWQSFCEFYQIGISFLGFDQIDAVEKLTPVKFDDTTLDALIDELLFEVESDEGAIPYELLYNMSSYLTGDTKLYADGSKKSIHWGYLFPSYSKFPKEYAYVHKFPFLLPIGWIHRLVHHFFMAYIKKDGTLLGTERMRRVEAKVYRLKKAGLL